jgi:serine phosphatase RsbU (regulator of sigma subunit)
VLCADGVTESFDDSGEEFGERRPIAALRRHRDLPPPSVVIASIVHELRQFSTGEQHDNITLMTTAHPVSCFKNRR